MVMEDLLMEFTSFKRSIKRLKGDYIFFLVLYSLFMQIVGFN